MLSTHKKLSAVCLKSEKANALGRIEQVLFWSSVNINIVLFFYQYKINKGAVKISPET